MQSKNYSERLARLRSALAEIGAEGIFVSGAHNRRWLSGFTGSSGWLLVTADRAFLATDFRYWQQATSQAPDFALFKLTANSSTIDLLRSAQICDVALESQHVTLRDFKALQNLDDINWLQTDGLVEGLRMIKDDTELETIRTAASITDAAMREVPQLVRAGMSELDLAWTLEKQMREAGATGLVFPVHVATGPNAALPHHAPGERVIETGDIVLVDMGASVVGYGSDLTRTFLLADEVDPLFEERYSLVLKAHDEALAHIRPGKTGREIDAIARELLAAGGYGEHFGHGLGHGLGLEGHEGPRLSATAGDTTLAAGMVTTVEPGVYLPGWGGIRIEDLVVVTPGGSEKLSNCPYDPLIRG